jgi:hypothetical protein
MVRAIRFVAVVAALAPAYNAAQAQQFPLGQDALLTRETTETNRAPIIPFLEGTDVFWTIVKKDSLDEARVFFPNKLEANIFPHLVVYQTFTDVLDVDRQAARADRGEGVKEFSLAFSGTPAVRIRMLRDRSAPVRTPSYMPRGNFQVLWVRGLKDGVAPEARGRRRALTEFIEELRRVPRISIWEAHVIAGHHSNGQDGCLSTEQRLEPPPPEPDGECLPPGVVPTAATMNRIDGSFSSAFNFRFGVNYSRNWMRDLSTPPLLLDLQSFREARLVAELEYHPRRWVDEQMRDIYGRHRVHVGGALAGKGLRGCQKRLEWSGDVFWNPGVVDPELDWSGALQVSCFPWMNGGWGFFARFYAGQDYYNVGFLDDISRLHVGMTFNQADFFRFRRRPAQRPSRAPGQP